MAVTAAEGLVHAVWQMADAIADGKGSGGERGAADSSRNE